MSTGENFEISNARNPRATVIESSSMESGVKLEIARDGLRVFAWHGNYGCGDPVFISWDRFDAYRQRARLAFAEAEHMSDA